VGESLAKPKTEAARREVSLPRFLMTDLAKHIEGLGPDDLVFTSSRGAVLHASNVWRSVWLPALKAAGVEGRVRIHDLRHTAVSLAIQAGAHPKEIQAMAGHSKYQTTMDVYGKVMPGMGRALASRMDALRESALGAELGNEPPAVVTLRSEKAV
jgi:integrase